LEKLVKFSSFGQRFYVEVKKMYNYAYNFHKNMNIMNNPAHYLKFCTAELLKVVTDCG
jgi:hypothetical protein